MDKEEFRIKLDEINALVEKKDYKSAMEIVDSIDWRRVKNVRILCTVGEIYAANKRYKDSREIFLLAYHRAPVGKTILYRLIEVSIKIGDLDEALEYYTDFVNAAPNDNTRYILKYKIYSARKAPIEQQIEILEQYKEKEYTERWSYELAKLYYKAGEREKCIDTCDDISLWFREGKYVIKCLELKQRLEELTPSQKEIYNNYYKPTPFMQEKETAVRQNVVEMPKEESEKTEEAAENTSTREEMEFTREIKVPSRATRARKRETLLEQEEEKASTVREAGEIGQEKEESVKEQEKEPVKKLKMPSLDETIASISRTASDIHSDEAFQQKLTKGIKDIFRGGRKAFSEDEELSDSGEEKTPAVGKINFADVIPEVRKEIQEEVPSLETEEFVAENLEVKELEPETPQLEQEALEDADFESEEAESLAGEAKVPKPKSFSVFHMPKVDLNETFKVEDLPIAEEFTIDLEQTILAAAQSQGIEVPDTEPESAEVLEKEAIELEEESAECQGEQLPEIEIPGSQEEQPLETEVSESQKEQLLEIEVTESLEEQLSEIEIPELEEEAAEVISSEASGMEVPGLEDESEVSIPISEEEMHQPEDLDLPSFMNSASEVKEAFEESVFEEVQGAESLTEEEELMRFIDEKNQDPNVEERDLIPREDKLDEEEVKLFKYFSSVPGVKEQLVEALKDVQMAAADKTSNTGNIILMGNRGCGKTTLSELLIKAICRELKMPAAKAAKVTAEQLRNKDMAKIVDQLSGGFLLIQNVNQLDAEIVDQLNHAMEFRTDGLTVILEDEKIGMRKFIARNPKFIKKFTSTIAIPVFTNDELVNFAKIYTNELGYKIDEMGILALYTLISNNQKEDEPMTVGTVKILVDNAIAKAESGTRKLQRNLSKTRTDRDGMVLLYEKDFK